MAVPKKKTSRARRDKRRAGIHHQLRPVTWTTSSINNEIVRPHCATLETIDEYVKAKKERRAAASSSVQK